MVATGRRGSVSMAPLERRSSNHSTSSGQETGRVSSKPTRLSVAPINVPRGTRASLLASSLGFTGATEGRHATRGSLGTAEEVFDEDLEVPSPTATRLRSLARSVRAAHVLGSLKVRKRYLASSPMAAAGTGDSTEDTAAKRSSINPLSARVIVLPTHEFSTAEMKFRLDPLEPTSPAATWDVHGVIEAIAPGSGAGSGSGSAPRAQSASSPVAVQKTARSGSVVNAAVDATNGSESGSTGKVRWKNAVTKTTAASTNSGDKSTSSNNGSPSPALRRGASNSAGAKRSVKRNSSAIGLDPSTLLGFGGGGGGSGSSTQDSQLNDHPQSTRTNLEARLRCARSLYKLSCQAGCESAIIRGGAIAQLVEVSDVDHIHLHELCAATLANLTTDAAAIDAFVSNDGIPALLELSWSPSIPVKLMCTTALCRLSARAAHAAALAKCRASIEFLAMLSLPVERLQTLAISCMVNLIFFGHSFPDRVFLGDPHALQNQAGILTVTNQLASALPTMHFAAEVLFNLALYRTSCSGALRGGGADIIHTLAVQVSKTVDEHHHIGSSNNMLAQQHTPRLPISSAMTLLRLIAHTLANFSSHVDFHAMINTAAMKTLMLMLSNALRDLGSRFYGGLAEERLRILAVPCSRALANLSSNEELRKQGFSPEMVQLTTRLFLVNRAKLFSMVGGASKRDETSFARNILCAMVNLSFDEQCAAHFMEFPEVMPRLTRLVLKGKNEPLDDSEFPDDNEEDEESSDDDDDDDDPEGDLEKQTTGVNKGDEGTESSSTATADALVLADTQNQMKEKGLVAILNLSQQGAYSHELLKHLDGKLLARAAEEQDSGSRLKYVYDVVLSNILFETRLQQIVYGDLVVNSLIDGFYFFLPTSTSSGRFADPFTPEGAALAFQSLNLAFADDQERFLSAIVTIAGELMDARNIERLVGLALSCIRPVDPSLAPAIRKRRKQITCYAAAILYTLARSSAQRGDTTSRIYSSETLYVLIAVCERQAPPSASGDSVAGGPVAYCATTQAFCAATLYHLCATNHFNPRVIQALIAACNSNEESLSLLACSAAFAIISFTPEGRQQLVSSADLAKALNRLGRTSQVECQQYAAVAACNVSTLECIWTSNELKDFIVVALLRANSMQAKQIHAKTLANLLSHVKTRAKAVEDGVLYALMKLSQVVMAPTTATDELASPDVRSATGGGPPSGLFSPSSAKSADQHTDEVFNLGLQVLFNLSCEQQYHQKLMGNGVIAYLATAVMSNKQPTAKDPPVRLTASSLVSTASDSSTTMPLASSVSAESRRYAMGIICNLSSYEFNHKELMNAQVIDLIRSYVDHDVETRASAAMAIRNLSCRQPWVEMICERRTLQMMIGFTHCDHAVVRHFAIQALANCSQVTDSLHLFGELKVTRAVMSVLDSIQLPGNAPRSPIKSKQSMLTTPTTLADTHETSMAALKCLHNIAADDALAINLMQETAILRLQPLMESRELDRSEEACVLAASMISVLAGKPRCAEALLKQRVVGFCALLHRKHPTQVSIAYECAVILMKLSTYQPIQSTLTETQAIQVIVTVCSSLCAVFDPRIRECGAIAIRNLTLSVAEQLSVFYDEASADEIEPTRLNRSNSQASHQSPTRGKPTRRDDDSEVVVTRLMERHLLQGVQFFQDELQRFVPEEPDATADVLPNSNSARILVEACAGLANLSTVKTFRSAMVHQGVVATLLRIFQLGRLSDGIPPIVRSMCCTTLHRLALEDGATIDSNGLLVPSLLEILQQSDEELDQVRYECEKVSLPTSSVAPLAGQRTSATTGPLPSLSASASSPPRPLRRTATSTGDPQSVQRTPSQTLQPLVVDKLSQGLAAMVATTTCVKQTYREPRWIAYVVKTMLSSAAMVPTLEKKQIRSIGMPKLSFFDAEIPSATTAAPSEPADDSETATSKRKGGYLLPIHTEKFTSHLASCLQDGVLVDDGARGVSIDGLGSQHSTARSSASQPSAREDRESLVHSRKFDRHMRLTRRNHRRTNLLPVLSFM